MVNWKAPESTDRLLASLIVAHPGLKLDYSAMAAAFGQGATYDSIEGRFRKWRKLADELRGDLESKGITELPRGRGGLSGSSTPRTPRGARNGITKVTQSASSSRVRKDGRTIVQKTPTRPAKGGSSINRHGNSLVQAIFVEDSGEDEKVNFKRETSETVRSESAAPDLKGEDVMIVEPPTSSSALASNRHNTRSDSSARKTVVPDLPVISSGFGHDISSAGVSLGHSSLHPMDDIQHRLHENTLTFDHLLGSVPTGSYFSADVV
ncbi:uncharacterized protein BO97DRAFT_69872 [Aspergillus homomorphus CBS 101889]|uniref:Uncharacterized protein n=1 Tax=Aspergillus homomorphus (strain CBS 101889) TaxID=1450537 RepID=A0A395HX42_ASPHC|nr:hypothetical protein BO97DRAFT_69872 [Aspergillus homomorphus CBS 101889]RAL12069.1 hypothetical protein BO97DRAFT_69872 [Aspergillus homomorphus CBS 101889]